MDCSTRFWTVLVYQFQHCGRYFPILPKLNNKNLIKSTHAGLVERFNITLPRWGDGFDSHTPLQSTKSLELILPKITELHQLRRRQGKGVKGEKELPPPPLCISSSSRLTAGFLALCRSRLHRSLRSRFRRAGSPRPSLAGKIFASFVFYFLVSCICFLQ